MPERIITTEMLILRAFMNGNHREVRELLKTLTYEEANRYSCVLEDLSIRVENYVDELGRLCHEDEDRLAKLRHDAEDVARLIREIKGED